jgi:hypothetical protein
MNYDFPWKFLKNKILGVLPSAVKDAQAEII